MTTPTEDVELQELIDYLRQTRSFDFSHYKPATLGRRMRKRAAEVGVERLSDYIDYLEVHNEEFEMLFNSILINVTSFFRDPPAWKYLQTRVIPTIVEHNPSGSIRIWCAGCASGQEAYSIAMLFAETLGEDAYHRRVKIYATDLDEDALATARAGIYTAKQMDGVPEDLRARYFDATDGAYTFRADWRRSVIFGRHDLTRDAPISRLDLLTCRNTLMYFNAGAQADIARRLHFALKPDGFLFLGRAEMLLTREGLFRAISAPQRFFVKSGSSELAEHMYVPTLHEETEHSLVAHRRMRELAFQEGSTAQVVIDLHGEVVAINRQARDLLDLNQRQIGTPFRDLELSYRPIELRGPIDEILRDRKPLTLPPVDRALPNGDSQNLDITLTPLITDGDLLGVCISFSDVTHQRRLAGELQRSMQELENAHEELQSTNEELETTNEELQSTNEELETTNEELQSTNEELETTNEELRATNEQVEAINHELSSRTSQLDVINAYMNAIMNSLDAAIVVLDAQLIVQAWNAEAEELWGVRADETIGQPFFDLDIGLPVEQVRPTVATCIDTGRNEKLRLDAITRRGKPVMIEVSCTPLSDHPGGVVLGLHAIHG